MRKLCLVAVSLSSFLWAQPPESAELQAAKKPVEMWMGRQLVIYEGVPVALPSGAVFVAPREARITAEVIAVSMDQLRSFQSSQELAEFLAHAAAHSRLGHPERLATLAKAVAILAPDRAASILNAKTRAEMEEETKPVAAELMESAGCAPGSCGMFGLLLRAARR
jgi:Zn-dependent protease with chaperone function